MSDPTYITAGALKQKRKRSGLWGTICDDFKINKLVYLMALPVVAYLIIFKYMPMYGILIAFKDYSISKGVWKSEWIGLTYFINFFSSPYLFRTLRNTFLISLYDLIYGFPAPIILALLLNEIKTEIFKRTVQTISYLPHFVSTVVICGLLSNFFMRDGLINNIIASLGGSRIAYLMRPEWFRTIIVSSNIWQGIGWGSIIYLAALSSIDQEIYQAAKIDGANRWKQMWHVTLPGIAPTIVIMLILRMGHLLSVGYEKILLLYIPNTYETGDVIGTYVYRTGIQQAAYGYSTAVGLFNSIVNLAFLFTTNWISKRFSENSLW